jgi:hypothetical protein
MSDYDINKMDFKQLRGEVQRLRDELAIFRRKFEDIIYNLDSDNFSSALIEKGENMQTSIEQTEESITLHAEKIAGTESAVAAFRVSANERSSKVEKVNGEVSRLSSNVSQTASSLKSVVAAVYSNPVEVHTFNPGSADKNKIYFDTSSSKYYYYDGTAWRSTTNANFGSVFEQTAEGFRLKGHVEIASADEANNKVMFKDGHVLLAPNGDEDRVKMRIGFNDDSDTRDPFIQFGEGSSGTSSEVIGLPTTKGTGLIYKSGTQFKILFFASNGDTLGVYFQDVDEAAGIEKPYISFQGDVYGVPARFG